MVSAELKNKISNDSLNLFFTYGVKNVSMDDISRSMGISKKTLYQHFDNKASILKSIIESFIQDQDEETYSILDEEIDVIEKILKIYSRILSHFKSCNPAFIFGLKKYYPDIFGLFVKFKKDQLLTVVTQLLKQGKNECVFRNDIDENLIYELHLNRIKSIITETLLPDRHIGDPVFFEVLKTSLRGITTLKGHKILDSKVDNQKEIKNILK
jgi:AcrR family transcriptional regulator